MMTETSISKNERRYLAFILLVIVFFVGVDLLNDSAEGVKRSHLILELAIALGAGTGIVILMKESFRKSQELIQSRGMILEREKEVKKWKAESEKYVRGLSTAIDAQLARWMLSPSEKEIALLLLKGLSLKEIADIRNTSEKTVRAQSVTIYSKSGLDGRSGLAAFFLEDLLGPQKNQSAS